MKNPSKEDTKQPQIIVFWIMWFGILSGIVLIQILVGGGIPNGSNSGKAPLIPVVICSILGIISMAVRFVLIPKASELLKLLPLMIIGLAMAEMVGILGVFLLPDEVPETKLILFVSSVFFILLYAPVYAQPVLNREEMR